MVNPYLAENIGKYRRDQVSVAETLDSATHRINHCPADKYEENQ